MIFSCERALLNAAISFISYADPDLLASYNYFSIGGLSGVQNQDLLFPALLILASFIIALIFAKQIDLLCLGDALAASLGARVKTIRLLCLLLAGASAAAAVSFAGLLGFIGLIVPHIARRLAGSSLRLQLAESALLGGILLIAADLLGRLIIAPSELPVGIITALLGAPFFLYLLCRKENSHDL
jgi:iron complex transport system permease protein